jgi:ParB family transcriptional regulator, chromosome partitioning protein
MGNRVTNDRKILHISRIRPHPGNVRDDLGDLSGLVASIRAHGILQPIVVEDQPLGGGQFQIIAGHRRFAAAKKAGLDMVPVVFAKAAEDTEPEELMLVENLQRSDLNPVDKARAFGALRRKGYSVARICASVGVSDATVYTYLSLLDLDQASQEKVRAGHVSASDAVAGIRRLRKAQRQRQGKPQIGPGEWEPDHFTSQHPLAKKARALCEAREHSMRRRVGKTACGQCWETVIRADERTVAGVLADDPASLRSAL